MNPQDIDRIKAYCEKAYPGPWIFSKQYKFRFVLSSDNGILWSGKPDRDEDNMRFCANARTDLPAAIAEIERLRALLEDCTQ